MTKLVDLCEEGSITNDETGWFISRFDNKWRNWFIYIKVRLSNLHINQPVSSFVIEPSSHKSTSFVICYRSFVICYLLQFRHIENQPVSSFVIEPSYKSVSSFVSNLHINQPVSSFVIEPSYKSTSFVICYRTFI